MTTKQPEGPSATAAAVVVGAGATAGLAAVRTVTRRLGEGDGLGAVQALAAARAGLELLAREAVWQARDDGASWQDLGRALGTSKQAAHERYGDRPTPGGGRPLPAPCVFADQRESCAGVGVVMRGTVPLCQPCSDASSTLSRQPARPTRGR